MNQEVWCNGVYVPGSILSNSKIFCRGIVGGGVMRTIIYTVDDEEPDCNRCDHCCGEDYYCIKQCGAEHGWNGYERLERIESDEE